MASYNKHFSSVHQELKVGKRETLHSQHILVYIRKQHGNEHFLYHYSIHKLVFLTTLAPKGDTVIQISISRQVIMRCFSSSSIAMRSASTAHNDFAIIFKGANLLERLMKDDSGFQTATCENCAGCCMYLLYE